MSFKILIIADRALDYIGGVEKYNKALIKILNENFESVEIDMILALKTHDRSEMENVKYHRVFNTEDIDIYNKKGKFFKFLYAIKYLRKLRTFTYKFLSNNKYNLIIDSTIFGFPKIQKWKNYFLVQHFNWTGYIRTKEDRKTFYKKLLYLYESIFLKKRNIIKNVKNLIVYDKSNENFIRKYTNANIFQISLYSDIALTENINIESRNKIIFLGRIEQQQKNIKDLIFINDKLNGKIDFYGQSYDKEGQKYLDILKEKGYYKGSITDLSEKKEILKKYKFSIIYSDFEGFSFSLVESLSMGIPIILRNTFLSASFLCDNSNGILLDKNNTLDKDISLITDFISMSNEEYKKYAQNALNFYKNNLSYNIFEEKWINIFKKFFK